MEKKAGKGEDWIGDGYTAVSKIIIKNTVSNRYCMYCTVGFGSNF
jgi:hypothetical protein